MTSKLTLILALCLVACFIMGYAANAQQPGCVIPAGMFNGMIVAVDRPMPWYGYVSDDVAFLNLLLCMESLLT